MSTADLFVEAIDTLLTLLRSAALWFVLMAVVVGIVLAAAVAAVQAVARGVWRTVRAAWTRGRAWTGPEAPERAPLAPSGAEEAPKPAGGRTRPSWAHEPTDLEEAA